MGRSWGNLGNFAALDPSVASSGGVPEDHSDVASMGSGDLSSVGGPVPLRRSRSFGEISKFMGLGGGGTTKDAAAHGPRRGKKPATKPASMKSINTFAHDDEGTILNTHPTGTTSGGTKKHHQIPPTATIVGMPADAAQAVTTGTGATEGIVRVIRTSAASYGTESDDSSEGSGEEAEQEYLQLCIPSSTNTLTTAGTDSSLPSPVVQSPLTMPDDQTKGGLFQRLAGRAVVGSTAQQPNARKTLLPPWMRQREELHDGEEV